ncbi:MAG: hypothetical protein WBG54_06755 [Acidobacteriaceae bacterium]
MPGKIRIGIAAAAVLALFAGCSTANKPTPENFTRALNDYYQDRQECLFPNGQQFPYEVAPGVEQKKEQAQMNALTAAGLMVRLEDRTMHIDKYTLNVIGQRYAPRFCYGHRQVTGIVSFTPPGPRNGFTETTVTYRYTMMDVPVWAQTDQVKDAFPELAQALSASPTAQATLATVGAGWHVPH